MRNFRALLGAAALAALVLLSACKDGGPKPLNINDIKSDPTAYTGEIRVTGIMAATAPADPRLFGVMDLTELACTTPNCNKYLLPVRYEGNLPALGDEVVVTGSFLPGGQVFAATSVTVVRNHKIAGGS